MIKRFRFELLSCFLATSCILSAQQATTISAPAPQSTTTNGVESLPIGPGDLITVHVLGVSDLDQTHIRVTDSGEVPLLLLGSVKLQGLTPAAAAQKILAAYVAQNLLRSAEVQVTVEEYASSTVTIFGYIQGPPSGTSRGVSIPLTTPKPLVTVLALAGGFADTASRTVTVQRRDPSIKPFDVFLPNDPIEDVAHNPLIYPGDTITVPRAGIVYVLGSVGKPSGVYMNEDGKISLMQALTQSGSTMPAAALRNVRIFRKHDGTYSEIKVDVGKVATGKAPDVALAAQDVIWVPFSYGKNILINGTAIVAALSSATATGIVYAH